MAAVHAEIAIIGTGITGISTAYYLAKNHGLKNILMIDCHQPMAFTSAQSGENYRNWWARPEMVALTNRSIDLMEEVARESANQINMNRRGYSLATRKTDIDMLVTQLHNGLEEHAGQLLRFHERSEAPTYKPPIKPDWSGAPDGVDILRHQDLIRKTFPSYSNDIRTVIHIRRGGTISSQQLGMYMLEYLKEVGARRLTGLVENIHSSEGFRLQVRTTDGAQQISADQIVNAAGPFADKIASMLGLDLPVFHTFQQKIAFEDRANAIPRDMPFSIDLDGQKINWSDEEREMLLDDPEFRWLGEDMPGAVHCRPDGGDGGTWLKLGWAYNETPAPATWDLPLDSNFPDIVLRGASRLNPSLKVYLGQLPRNTHHYGGWYTMTDENWPLIGPMGQQGAFMNCALSGFGTMAASASGELCAKWVAEAELPSYARGFSLDRYQDNTLMAALLAANKGRL